MARKVRIELPGGLYHVITRGNNRRRIFDSPADYDKFLSLLSAQKTKLPFFLYAYCLMTNHVHLLIERQTDAIGRIMHRLLTGYSQYFNRRYRRVGHLLQGRHKAILCQSDQYLSELVRYIHLNPVRARMVCKPEQYRYSSHRSYLGLEASGLVDVDPVLRHFGAKKNAAREQFAQFVRVGIKLGHREEFYQADEGRILGGAEFVDSTIHRIGEAGRPGRSRIQQADKRDQFSADELIAAIEMFCRVPRASFCGPAKSARVVRAKEALILIGAESGIRLSVLSELTGTHSSTISRRLDAARVKVHTDGELRQAVARVRKEFQM